MRKKEKKEEEEEEENGGRRKEEEDYEDWFLCTEYICLLLCFMHKQTQNMWMTCFTKVNMTSFT
jgi:hypothetical protein